MSPSVTGFGLGLTKLPQVLRIPMGVLTDKYDLRGWGHRKPYMMIGLCLSIMTFVALGVLDINHTSFTTDTFTVLYFVIYLFVSLSFLIYDTAADGFLTVSVVSLDECICGSVSYVSPGIL